MNEASTIYFSAEIIPEKSRSKQFRFIFNTFDLKAYFDYTVRVDHPIEFIRVCRITLDKLVLWRKVTSMILALPVVNTSLNPSDNPDLFVFQNIFMLNNYDNKLKVGNYLEPKNF